MDIEKFLADLTREFATLRHHQELVSSLREMQAPIAALPEDEAAAVLNLIEERAYEDGQVRRAKARVDSLLDSLLDGPFA